MDSGTISVDEFQALEQKVLQTVELIKREREARTAAEAEIAVLREDLEKAQSADGSLRQEIETLKRELAEKDEIEAKNEGLLRETETLHKETEDLMREREAVRLRVEKMLATMDELL